MNIPQPLPPNWQLVTLEEVCDIVVGQSPSSDTYNFDKIGLPFFQGKAEFTDLYPVVEKWCSVPNKIAEPGDILISVRAPVGSTNIANVKCCIGRGLCAIRYSPNNKFLFFYFKTIVNDLDAQGTGTTFKAISGEIVKNTPLPLPPLAEQHRIVAKIEELFSGLDAGVASLKAAQQQLKVYRQAVLKAAFEGKLTPDMPAVPASHALPGSGKQAEIFAQPAENEDLTPLPDGWRWVKLDSLASDIADGDHQPPPKAEAGVPFITISNINKNLNTIKFENSFFVSLEYFNKLKKKRKPQKGDILYTVTGSFGIPVLIDFEKEFCFQRHIAIIKLKNGMHNKYLYYSLQSIYTTKQAELTATGTAQKTVALSSLRNFLIPLPPSIDVQAQIVAAIEERLSVADKLSETVETALAQAEVLRQSILKRAFAGQLVPQDPAEPPVKLGKKPQAGKAVSRTPNSRKTEADPTDAPRARRGRPRRENSLQTGMFDAAPAHSQSPEDHG